MKIQRRLLVSLAAATLASALAPPVVAQSFPSKTVTLVVPATPGGTADIVGRLIASKLSQMWGQPVVVENRPGAGTLVGSQQVARAAPDGHTLLISFTELATLAAINRNARLDPVRDLARVAKIGGLPVMILGRPGLPARNMSELVTLLKQSPEKYTYSSSGSGSILQLYAELFQQVASVDLRHIPYRGALEASSAVLTGEVDLLVQFASGNVMNYVMSGRAQAFAVASPQRLARLPDVPTTAEVGMPQLQLQAWYGFFAPAGTPAAIVRKINEDLGTILKLPDVRERLASVNMQPDYGTVDSFDRFFLAEHQRWTRVIRDAGIKAN